MTALDIITRALKKIGALAAGEPVKSEDAADSLIELNSMIDLWNARALYVYATQFTLYTLQAGLQPHTIGPSGTFTVPQRPVKIVSAAFRLQSSPTNFDLPINIRDDQWWANERVKNLTSNVITDLYYSPDWLNGSLFFWPVPNTASQVLLEAWTVLSQFPNLTTTFSLPPGYQDAITLSLAIKLAPLFGDGKTASPSVIQEALYAVRTIQGNNDKAPRIQTVDSGMPDKASHRSTFNWETGNLV